jgi:hypothetical protein
MGGSGVLKGRLEYTLLSLVLLIGYGGPGQAHGDQPTTLVFPTFQHTWGIRKATPAHLFLFLGLKTKFNDPQGLAAVRLRRWEDPTTQDDDDELCVYGVNSGEHNIIYNTSMYSVGVYGEEGEGEGQFRNPRGIAADEHGHVYVADAGNHRVVHLLNTGKELVWTGTLGSFGDGPGHFRSPCGVALDSQGRLYVTDTGNSRVQIFDNDGQYLGEISGHFNAPEGIAVIDAGESWSYYGETYLCVVDSGGHRLQKFSSDGRLLAKVHGQQTDMTTARFAYLAIDYYGSVWVTDPENHCLHKFDRQLNFVVSFGSKGTGDREFISPRGVAIWRRFGQVFVAEERGAQYYWVGVDLLRVEVQPSSTEKGLLIRFFLTERAYLRMDIWDDQGELVRILAAEKIEPLGRREHLWDGRNARGDVVPSGLYRVRIIAEPTYSSFRYFQKVVEKRVKL